jgi:3'-phosphoadenosine 5'-phosphosulfate sulfotransferase (PAPS reductase)/FAD synthetase
MLEEDRIGAMERRGEEIINEATERFKPVAMLAAFSGGNDSVVSTHFVVAKWGPLVVHCDTGIGLQITKRHVEQTAKRLGWVMDILKAEPEGRPPKTRSDELPHGGWMPGKTAYEEFVLNFGFPGPAQHYRMYQRLKERPLRRAIRKLKLAHKRGSKVLVVSGIRGDESVVRAGYRRPLSVVGDQVWVNPFYDFTAADFGLYREEFGLPRNPATTRVGISGECLCGAFANPKDERAAIRAIEPETANYLDDLEARARRRGLPCRWGERPPGWFLEAKAGQQFLFDMGEGPMPMCVGCARKQKGPANANLPPL